MTLCITAVSETQGAWQSADHKITWFDRNRPPEISLRKQFFSVVEDGSFMLGLSGAGSLGTVDVVDWLTNELTTGLSRVHHTLQFIAERATDQLAKEIQDRNLAHTFAVVAYVGGQPELYTIQNYDTDVRVGTGPPLEEFMVKRHFLDRPILTGIVDAVSEVDRAKLDRIWSWPRDPEQYEKLLVSVNRRAAADKRYNAISKSCTVARMHLNGSVSMHTEPDPSEFCTVRPMPAMLGPIDLWAGFGFGPEIPDPD